MSERNKKVKGEKRDTRNIIEIRQKKPEKQIERRRERDLAGVCGWSTVPTPNAEHTRQWVEWWRRNE